MRKSFMDTEVPLPGKDSHPSSTAGMITGSRGGGEASITSSKLPWLYSGSVRWKETFMFGFRTWEVDQWAACTISHCGSIPSDARPRRENPEPLQCHPLPNSTSAAVSDQFPEWRMRTPSSYLVPLASIGFCQPPQYSVLRSSRPV